jgi:hypothetical protein
MVMNTRSGSQTNRQPVAPQEPAIQNNLQPPPNPPPGGGDQDRIAALEAQIEDLNAELLRMRQRQPNPEMNRDEREEEDHNSNINPRREDDRQGDLSRIIAELERRCTYMEMERKDKGRSVMVDKLLMGTDSPFTRRVADYQLPDKFKVPQILSYAGDRDPLDHLENFKAHLDLHGTPDEVACRAFPLTLAGNARDWFRKLPPNSVDQFKELSKIFLTEFLAFRTRKKPSGYLLSLHQQGNESLKEFMARFNREKATVEDPTEDMIFAAIYQGISPEEPLMKKLIRKQPSTLQGLMDKVEEFINQEETLKSMASSRLPRETAPEKKRKEFRKADWEEQRQVKKFKDYNFTPLNAEISEVLMEIKKDPAFREPQKIPGNPPYKNAGKYCDFHKQAGHYTEGCVTLRLLIEEFIKNGKLVRFLGERRNHPGNNRPRNHQDYQPRDQQPRDYYPRDRPQLDERHQENAPRDDIERREDRRSRSPQHREPRQQQYLPVIP